MSSSPPPDAPAALDLDALESKAKAATKELQSSGSLTARRDFIAACDPDTVLELIRRLRRYEAAGSLCMEFFDEHSHPDAPVQYLRSTQWFIALAAALGSPGEEGEPAE